MTNHSGTTGTPDNDDTVGGERQRARRVGDLDRVPAVREHPLPEHQVTLRTPDELADALPYLLGYRPEDSIVLVALHDADGRGRFGGRARLGIPASADDWESAAGQLAHGLVTGSERRGARPEQMVAFLCQEPAKGETGRQVMERLRPLAQKTRLACGSLDVPVVEALCISDGRFWSYCCDRDECCPPEGRPMGLPGTSVLAAAAAYAGVQVRGSLRQLRARLQPLETGAALEQEVALDTVALELVPRVLDVATRAGVAVETLQLAERLLRRFAEAPVVSGTLIADLRDDELLAHDEAARLILGLQDRATRDRVAEWMEDGEAAPALRLWRALARRCVRPYHEHAAAPLTLAGWVAWSSGDDLEAREAFAMALAADPDYLFARLLHQACNEGLDPESIRRCLRAERTGRGRRSAEAAEPSGEEPSGEGPGEKGSSGEGLDGVETSGEGLDGVETSGEGPDGVETSGEGLDRAETSGEGPGESEPSGEVSDGVKSSGEEPDVAESSSGEGPSGEGPDRAGAPGEGPSGAESSVEAPGDAEARRLARSRHPSAARRGDSRATKSPARERRARVPRPRTATGTHPGPTRPATSSPNPDPKRNGNGNGRKGAADRAPRRKPARGATVRTDGRRDGGGGAAA
ncbi:DUF4192 family protein [Streptomyces sp. SS1-1]|uniref:DUF4192 family protein n=1 Tax=Streptomyces sp. SS1-1 TaxID=2651869 RepID=UPI00124F9F98|nr:DUF4192 family protein [Streptomyces sp. SS1-1]KAB2975221.1 DUF4192 family protein [Streptomyces sp. SS1-1]